MKGIFKKALLLALIISVVPSHASLPASSAHIDVDSVVANAAQAAQDAARENGAADAARSASVKGNWFTSCKDHMASAFAAVLASAVVVKTMDFLKERYAYVLGGAALVGGGYLAYRWFKKPAVKESTKDVVSEQRKLAALQAHVDNEKQAAAKKQETVDNKQKAVDTQKKQAAQRLNTEVSATVATIITILRNAKDQNDATIIDNHMRIYLASLKSLGQTLGQEQMVKSIEKGIVKFRATVNAYRLKSTVENDAAMVQEFAILESQLTYLKENVNK